ncbi:hypothetical protein [Chondromyces apiculatus]|uniref:EVE domain-containing protein n=1 Tax=Chondromyces apiculatus DSM 436 TaxID=1192034 RepID=A0A017TE22_9BACT|nr:hypothetical protein [Chondromyces apiculatus]EYF07167.1 Hypothetical protein CAP_0646 [Chondromyces apiculatus DSM 436]
MEWVYKATNSKLDHMGTMLMVDRDGFLCRSAYEAATKTWADNVRQVDVGDTVHVYFGQKGRDARPIGSFRVVEPDGTHPVHAAVGKRVEGTALHVVDDPSFIKRRDPEGEYSEDPILGLFTGWVLQKVGQAPPFRPAMFRGRTTLQPYTKAS